MRLRRLVSAIVLIVCVPLVLASAGSSLTFDRRLGEGLLEEFTDAPFYLPPDPVPAGAPGTIIRSEHIESAPAGSAAWRVLYRSTDVLGKPIVVSGVIVAPTGTAPTGGRTIVSWAHPTTGAAARCAPSVGIDPFDTIEGLSDLLHAGYVVVATDYPGLGVAEPDSYLIGTSEGNSVLDIARAARTIRATDAGTRLLLWGHSQGGQAALFAAQSAAVYAPELDLRGVAVAAPATDLGTLLDDDINGVSGVTIASYAFNAYAEVYGPDTPGARLGDILTPAGAAATPHMATLCLLGQNAELHTIAKPLVGNYLAGDPTKTEPWASLLAANTPGAAALTVPLFVAQGDIDTLVKSASTASFVAHERALGTTVTSVTIPNTGHGLVALRAMPAVLTWFAEWDR